MKRNDIKNVGDAIQLFLQNDRDEFKSIAKDMLIKMREDNNIPYGEDEIEMIADTAFNEIGQSFFKPIKENVGDISNSIGQSLIDEEANIEMLKERENIKQAFGSSFFKRMNTNAQKMAFNLAKRTHNI